MSGDRLASLINLDLPGANLFPRLGNTPLENGDKLQMLAKYRTFFDEGAAAAPASTASTYLPLLRRRRR